MVMRVTHASDDGLSLVRPLEGFEMMSLIGWPDSGWAQCPSYEVLLACVCVCVFDHMCFVICVFVIQCNEVCVSMAGNAFSGFAVGPWILSGIIVAAAQCRDKKILEA